ncbi:MAG: lipase family protein, partial [Acidimicrobiales bacterium]
VIAWAHGTTGIADKCAPSLQPVSAIPLANKLLDAGYLVAATDYEGLGTPGRHPYIVGDSEARGVLDSVRAARNLPDAHASDRFLVWGHSQGGHAAMFTWHDAAQWAPELHLVGAVAGAPPSQLELVYQALQNSPYKFYLLMAAAGFNAAYGNRAAPLDAVMTQQGIDQLPVVDQQCGDEMVKTFANVNTAGLVKADPASVPTWKKLLDENDPGKFTTAQPQQLLIIQGGNDEQIPVASTQLLYGQLCAIHQDTERWIYPGQSHAGVIPVSFDDMFHWIQDRFANKPGPDPLQPTGQADVQVQRCA